MNEPVPEFSRPVTVSRLPPSGIEQELEAKPAERAALAKRFDLVELKLLKAQLSLMPESSHVIKVTGTVQAHVVQSCVVTLEPVVSKLDIPLNVFFIPASEHKQGAGSPDAEDADEEIEVFSGSSIDLGETVAQHLGVNIDLYPRKPGVALGAVAFGPEPEKPQPFAQLAALAKKPKKQEKTDD